MSRPRRLTLHLALVTVLSACGGPVVSRSPTVSTSFEPTPLPSRIVHTGHVAVEIGEPITLDELAGRIVFDDFEDVFVMDIDGSDVVKVAAQPGPEFDGAWSPDGEWVVYRDSTRGINEDDEILVASADGSERRNITNDPANDWGPDWSPDGTTIVFNSDREGGGRLRGYLADPDGSNLRALDIDVWVEYPSFSPDGRRIVFEGHDGSDYEVYVADIATGETRQLTDAPGNDGWPVWSPDGATIAFSSERDDCLFLPKDQECWRTGEPDDQWRDVWIMDPDGANARRVSTELAQFVAWSPDSRYLLVSGRGLYVVRPDGTGRLELRADGIDLPLGGIPDWR